MMLFCISAQAQLLPLTAAQKVTMDSLDNINDNNLSLKNMLDASVKKVYKKSGKFYVTVEWENFGKEDILSFAGKGTVHQRTIQDDGLDFTIRPLLTPLQPRKPQLQDYELEQADKVFSEVPEPDEVFLYLKADTIKTTNNIFIRKKFSKKDKAQLVQLIEQDKEYNIYKEITERKQKYLRNQSKLKLLEGKFIKIDLEHGEPYIYCEFKNKSGRTINVYRTSIDIRSNSDKNSFWACGSGSDSDIDLPSNKITVIACKMSNIPYDKMQFPVTDLAQYDLTITAVCEMIKLDGIYYGTVEFDERDEESLRLLKEKYKIK